MQVISISQTYLIICIYTYMYICMSERAAPSGLSARTDGTGRRTGGTYTQRENLDLGFFLFFVQLSEFQTEYPLSFNMDINYMATRGAVPPGPREFFPGGAAAGTRLGRVTLQNPLHLGGHPHFKPLAGWAELGKRDCSDRRSLRSALAAARPSLAAARPGRRFRCRMPFQIFCC